MRQDGGEGTGTGGPDGAHVAQKEWVEGGILAGVEETPHVCVPAFQGVAYLTPSDLFSPKEKQLRN